MRELLTNFTWGLSGKPGRLLIERGRVVDRSYGAGLEAEGAIARDLGGGHLLPSFVDSHCHILPSGLALQNLNLSNCETREEVLDAVRDRLRSHPDGWLVAVYYDQTKYADGRDLTRRDLDAISSDRPIFLEHTNGHAGVANSGALNACGVDDATPDPSGGSYRRDENGAIDGVVYETAYERILDGAPGPSRDEMVEAILVAGERMAEFGIATATDMMTGGFNLPDELEAYQLASTRACKIRLRLYLQYGPYFRAGREDRARIDAAIAAMNPDRCRVAGIKIFADGAIASATAAIYGQFTHDSPADSKMPRRATPTAQWAPEGVQTDGQLIYSPTVLLEMVSRAAEAGFSVAVHSIGDYASDLVMNAFEGTAEPKRHRIEHAMILSDRQIERMSQLGIHCSMQPEFLMRLGHAYRRQLGSERASKLKRARSAIDAGVRMSFSSDRPVVFGDPWDGIRTASRRPEGYDPAENVTIREAIELYTAGGADANGEPSAMGNLGPGQIADWQVYDRDPTMANLLSGGPAAMSSTHETESPERSF